MKLNKLIYGILGIFAFSSCADQMEYHEYKSDGEEFVKLNFGNVGGLVLLSIWIWIRTSAITAELSWPLPLMNRSMHTPVMR